MAKKDVLETDVNGAGHFHRGLPTGHHGKPRGPVQHEDVVRLTLAPGHEAAGLGAPLPLLNCGRTISRPLDDKGEALAVEFQQEIRMLLRNRAGEFCRKRL